VVEAMAEIGLDLPQVPHGLRVQQLLKFSTLHPFACQQALAGQQRASDEHQHGQVDEPEVTQVSRFHG